MSLDKEIEIARQQIVKDGYDMSIGELMNLYKDNELIIKPEFQRYFRWEELQKTQFIESLLLGIPIPPIFVFQTDEGTWELIDGLQRLSTIFEFAGILKKSESELMPPSKLNSTKKLPSLENKVWQAQDNSEDGLTKPQQFEIKRARIRVEILGTGTNPYIKYELFQRLNKNGSILTPQEVRTASMVMINKEFYKWIVELSQSEPFHSMMSQTQTAIEKQIHLELTLRFFIYRNIPYQNGLDVHEYLDDGILQLATDNNFSMKTEEKIFLKTFSFLQDTIGSNVFKRWNGEKFGGKFVISAYEMIAIGVSKNLKSLEELNQKQQQNLIKQKISELWNNKTYQQYSGAGKSGTLRLAKLLPMAEDFFRP
jgi:hypothetical protein